MLKQHPEFANCSAEFANEMAVLPSPTQFAQEVAVATQANGGNRDLAFRSVCEKYPGMRSPELSNQISDEDAAEQRDRREKLQKLMQKRAKDLNLDLDDPAIYTRTFNLVLQDHPELAGHTPEKPSPMRWTPTASDGTTPPNKNRPYSGRGTAREYGVGAQPTRAKDMAV